jgi:DNA modification methylase
MNGQKADMVFTDPPYGIDYSGGRTQVVETKTYGKLMNDDLQGVELGELISNVFLFNKEDADVYVCVSPKMQKPFLDFIDNSGKTIDAVIVWDKKQPGLGYMAYRRQCEFILFVKGGGFKKGDTSDFDLWSISRDNGKDYVHGTQKPIGVPSRAINNSSKKDDLVLDYFGGSGSTMVASHQLKRKCYSMELDPKYCQVIIDRMKKLDPTLIIKRNGIRQD